MEPPLIISITGPESSGKSTLANQLALHFNAPCTEEYARTYLNSTGGLYAIDDLDNICLGQLKLQDEAVKTARDLVIFDTDMLVLSIWSKFRFGKVSALIESALRTSRVSLYLLCKPDIIWTPDPFRESPNQSERDLLFDLYAQYLIGLNARYMVVSGNYDNRFQSAIQAIESFENI